ncbi:LCP family protein [Streptomyces gobiensis]|uniref:LCP family protein n=1 Tax=Streptomyces gobiensis TaxID=2875706 RepID=UPI001E444EBF|nr:LCP family protein [Streptomyces gobiensis]UGY91776.1 LCP family protein [Streptomyces gobiensis]
MTEAEGDSEGTPRTPPAPGAGQAGQRGRPSPQRWRYWLRWVALGVSLLILVVSGVGWGIYYKLDRNITTDIATALELERHKKERPESAAHAAKNILILGSDTRSGRNREYGRDSGTARSDTAILLHLSGDRKSATAVSIPRDLMVTIPRCARPDGSRTKEQFAQFNWSYEFGGPACAIRTVEKLTRIRMDHHVVVDFKGFKKIVNAVGGVEVCLTESASDPDSRLNLPAGRQTLKGDDALAYVRARHGIGDGSDSERISRQQAFLASLFRKLRSNGVLMNPTKLYPVLDEATSAITADAGLNSLTELYDLVRSVRDMPERNVHFRTVPRRPYARNKNRDELVQPAADWLFAILRNDRVVDKDAAQEDTGDSTDDHRPDGPAPVAETPSPHPLATEQGHTASTDICDERQQSTP